MIIHGLGITEYTGTSYGKSTNVDFYFPDKTAVTGHRKFIVYSINKTGNSS